MIQSKDIIAVVIWYHPNAVHAQNLMSYANMVRHVIVVDNSTTEHQALQHEDLKNLTYIPLHDNLGIATALNVGCAKAIEMGAQWILTMDQDSQWQNGQLARYIQTASDYPSIDQVGVFSPRQVYGVGGVKQTSVYEEKIAVMTSGCLISAKGYERSNGFRDEFFIDEVDNEYCMHLRTLGMQVVICNTCELEHHLGERQIIRFLMKQKEYIRHAPFRYYYMVRNNLALSRLYPQYRRFNRKRLCKMLKRVLLYEKQNKLAVLRMCWKGYCDFRAQRWGRLDV